VIAGVADTHTALWYLFKNPKLSPTALAFIDYAAAVGKTIVLSPISFAEIVYLIEKARLPESTYQELMAAIEDDGYVIKEALFDRRVVEAMRKVSRADVPDMPDRIIAATAVHLGVPVISRDARIRASDVQTIW